jgi:hypothetical protein
LDIGQSIEKAIAFIRAAQNANVIGKRGQSGSNHAVTAGFSNALAFLLDLYPQRSYVPALQIWASAIKSSLDL